MPRHADVSRLPLRAPGPQRVKLEAVNTRLIQVRQRIRQLETVADEVTPLVERYYRDDHSADVDLSLKGQQWYRGCRELLAQNKLSGLKEARTVLSNTPGIAFVYFNERDVVRHRLVQAIISAYEAASGEPPLTGMRNGEPQDV